MFSRSQPTLTGLQGSETFNALSCSVVGIGTNPAGGTALTVAGNSAFFGQVSATSLAGCITDSLTTTDSTIAASATAVKNVLAAANACLPLSGGAVSGALTVVGKLTASNLSVLGTTTTVQAYTTVSSNLVVSSLGTGPALSVTQTESFGAQPVAQFYNGTDPALVIDPSGNLAVNKTTALYEVDVSGTVNATAFRGNGANLTGLPAGSDWASAGANTTLAVGKFVGVGVTPTTYQLDGSGTVRATAFSGNGAALTGVTAAGGWTVSGSSYYLPTGNPVGVGLVPSGGFVMDVSGNSRVSGATTYTSNVGIGKAPTGYALDVSGNVNATAITTGNSCSLMYWKVTGTTPTVTTSPQNTSYAFPTGVILANIVGIYGIVYSSGNTIIPMNNTNTAVGGNTGWQVMCYANASGVNVAVGTSTAGVSAQPFTVILVTVV